MTGAVADAVAAAHRAEWSRVVATLIRITRDWSLAEDCASEAFEAALAAWKRDGIPANPGAWLTTVAKNRALDRLRRSASLERKLEELAVITELDEFDSHAPAVPDDRLRLIFTCCHPALAAEARLALTLRTVGGLTTQQIAAAFLVPESTIAQRIVRAKRKITEAGIAYRVPQAAHLQERLGGVLAVLYLVFTSGYSAAADAGLADEAIRLTRALCALMPDEPEIAGLLSLMLLQHSRSTARVDATGDLVTLENQDRESWDAAAIAEAMKLIDSVSGTGQAGQYRLQAQIAAVHATAPSADATDWAAIVSLYDQLLLVCPTRVVEFNRSIAVGMALGAEAGILALDRIEGDFGHLRSAARADLLERAGRTSEAVVEYRAAVAEAPLQLEKRALARRLAELESTVR